MLSQESSSEQVGRPQGNRPRGLARDIVETFATRAAKLVLAFAASVVITRSLGAEGRGIYQLLNVTADVASLLATGGITRSLVYYLAGERRDVFLPVFCAHFAIRVALLGTLLPLVTLLPLDALEPIRTPERVVMLVLLAWALCLEGWIGAFLRAILRFRLANTSQLKASFGRCALLMALALTGTASVVSVALARVTTIFAMIPAAYRSAKELKMSFRPGWDAAANRQITQYGTLFFITLLFQNLHYKADIYLLQHWGSVRDVGVYTAGTQIVQMLWMLPAAVQTVLLPSSVGKDPSERGRAIAAAARTIGFVMTSAALAIALAAPIVLPLLYGRDFEDSGTVTRLLAPGIAANAYHQMSAVFLASQGQVAKLALVGPVGFALNVLANVYAIPRYGMYGAAAVSSFSYTSTAMLTTFLFCRAARLPMSEALLIRRDDVVRLVRLVRQRFR